MSLLLDTHVVLWWLADAPELPDEIKDRLDHETLVTTDPHGQQYEVPILPA